MREEEGGGGEVESEIHEDRVDQMVEAHVVVVEDGIGIGIGIEVVVEIVHVIVNMIVMGGDAVLHTMITLAAVHPILLLHLLPIVARSVSVITLPLRIVIGVVIVIVIQAPRHCPLDEATTDDDDDHHRHHLLYHHHAVRHCHHHLHHLERQIPVRMEGDERHDHNHWKSREGETENMKDAEGDETIALLPLPFTLRRLAGASMPFLPLASIELDFPSFRSRPLRLNSSHTAFMIMTSKHISYRYQKTIKFKRHVLM